MSTMTRTGAEPAADATSRSTPAPVKPDLRAGLVMIVSMAVEQRLCLIGGALPLVPFFGIALTLMVKAHPIYAMAWLVFRMKALAG